MHLTRNLSITQNFEQPNIQTVTPIPLKTSLQNTKRSFHFTIRLSFSPLYKYAFNLNFHSS